MVDKTEELQRLKKRNKYIINKVNEWQNFPFLKHLMCRNDGCDGKLVPKDSKFRVILVCPKCRAIQYYVPQVVIQTSIVISEKLKRAKSKIY
jgi:hypothetical protein